MAVSNINDSRGHYLSWFKKSLEHVKLAQEPSTPLDKVVQIAKDFSLLVSLPPESHAFVYQVALEENLLEEVNQACIFFQKFRETLTNGSHKKTLQWYSFEPLTETRWVQELNAFPLTLKEQRFKVVEVGHNKLQAYWKHLMTCLCAAASPEGIDTLAIQMAEDLKGYDQVALIDFGAGGCLPVLPIISRLTHMKQILLFLVDPIYPPKEHRVYRVSHHSISEKLGCPPLTDTQNSLAIMELMGNCATYFPPGCSLFVYVVGSIDQLIEERLQSSILPMPHVLFAIDPVPEAAADFKKAVHAIEGRKPSYYCLNEVAGVYGKLNKAEALDTDRIFSRIQNFEYI